MNQKMASKLANSVRQVRTEHPQPPRSRNAAESSPAPASTAWQGDQSPQASVYQPWDNLHPKRVWPD